MALELIPSGRIIKASNEEDDVCENPLANRIPLLPQHEPGDPNMSKRRRKSLQGDDMVQFEGPTMPYETAAGKLEPGSHLN